MSIEYVYDNKGRFERSVSYDRPVRTNKHKFENKSFTDENFEEMPLYDGKHTDKGFVEYIKAEIYYPPLARNNNIEGKVYISFVVNKYGNVVDEKVLRSVHSDLDKEALRVIRNSSGWTPGYQKGKPVKVSFTIPLNFKVN